MFSGTWLPELLLDAGGCDHPIKDRTRIQSSPEFLSETWKLLKEDQGWVVRQRDQEEILRTKDLRHKRAASTKHCSPVGDQLFVPQ